MNGCKKFLWLFLIFDWFYNFNCKYLKLYNTENGIDIQSYDCIYYTNIKAENNETTPYCIRKKENILLNRSFTKAQTCQNSGQEWDFKILKTMNITQDEILKWNSSIEMADQYAAYLTNQNEELSNEKICNCSANTFGKFCEYTFFTENTFEKTIEYQFDLKSKYRNGSQLWGNITCYTTLTNCYYGLRCLTWQNICDGKQQCMDGIDENHCEKLEYNECNDDEYRCEDGSCIPEQFWLDGQIDCADKSDELWIISYLIAGTYCPLTSSEFNCDESKDFGNEFACGDGQFVDDIFQFRSSCYNYRNFMYFCEFKAILTHDPLWTLDNGHCIEEDFIEKNLTDLNETEQCMFYLKCKLIIDVFSKINICHDVIKQFESICRTKSIIYPAEPVISPYIKTLYVLSRSKSPTTPNYVIFDGNINCIGYKARSNSQEIRFDWKTFDSYYPSDVLFCNNDKTLKTFNSHIAKDCWNKTKQSFLCENSYKCISKHRLRNGYEDCKQSEDEDTNQQCYMTKQNRFICDEQSPTCLTTYFFRGLLEKCEQGSDRYVKQLKIDLSQYTCTTPNSFECNLLKNYMKSPSSLQTIYNNSVLIFRYYCNNIWELPGGFDESLCKDWKCPKNQYQCSSGHCISLTRLDDVTIDFIRWKCPDGSDQFTFTDMTQLSKHNIEVIGYSIVVHMINKTIELNNTYFQNCSSVACNPITEFKCLLANVTNPFDFINNRACINMTQIGDGIIDCYGGLDERNLLTCGSQISDKRGFDFHCHDQQCIPYHQLCTERCSNRADSVLCDPLPAGWNETYYMDMVKEYACFTIAIEEYNDRRAFYQDDYRPWGELSWTHLPYQYNTWRRPLVELDLSQYPMLIDIDSFSNESIQLVSEQETTDFDNLNMMEENNGKEGWICGRGVAIKTNNQNQFECFCPPSLYGEFCQYFSDRITIITSLDNIPTELIEESSTNIIKIVALLLSSNDNDIIDYHIFHLPLILSKELNKKFRFNLIHRRPKIVSNSYKIRFEGYNLYTNSSIQFLATWEYPIEFPFLPSYRLVKILRFEKQLSSESICQRNNRCLHNSTCHPIMNEINNTDRYYCHCNNLTFGKHCEHYQQSLTCSKHSLIRHLSSKKSICLCSIHQFGPTCHLNHTCVNNTNICGGIHRGKCYPNPDNIIQDYICICNKQYFGNHCERDSAMVLINFTNFSFVQVPINYIMSSIIQLYDVHHETLEIIIRQKYVYQGLPPSITKVYHNDFYLPMFGLIKLYHKQNLNDNYVANLEQPDYFLLYVILQDIWRMNITSVMNQTNYCPSISYLSERTFIFSNESNRTRIIFKYHLLCDKPYSLLCFQDEHFFCLCDNSSRAECSQYNSKADQCIVRNRCRVDGQCIQGDLENRRDFLCLCPRCYYGSICQYNTQLFSFTLETLLTNDLYSSSIVIQQLFFCLSIIIPLIVLIIGGINNICCFFTFNRSKPLLVGTGHLLRTVSIINQFTLFMLLLKFLHLTLSIKGFMINAVMNTIFCKVFSYFLVCFHRMSYWLMSMIAIERVYVTWFLTGTWLNNPRITKRIIASIIISTMVCDIHELIYYQSIDDPKSENSNYSTWCVTSYPSAVSIYNQFNIILNYIVPFVINFLSTIIIIIIITRKRVQVSTRNSDRLTFRTYTDLLIKNKELIFAPLITMVPQLFSIPQFILSLSLACQEFDVAWQRYLLMISYFIMYLPQVISYKLYVSPSSFYTEEYRATKFYKRILKWQGLITRNR